MKKTRPYEPLIFQNQARKHYFEGWYFKQVSGDERFIFSVIPSMMRTKKEKKAMLQTILAEKIDQEWRLETHALDFPMAQFKAREEPFFLQVGDNTFSREGISLRIPSTRNGDKHSLELFCDITFGEFTQLPRSIFSPTIMGPFSYLLFMECIHGVASLHHSLGGSLHMNGKAVCFDGGVGYIEKDWGQSFPSSYVWLQSNHFHERPSGLFFSWADIPLGPARFPGFICHLWIQGKHHRFATYNGASCTIHEMSESKVSITLRKNKKSLSMMASADQKGVLSAPKNGRMDHQIKEGLAGSISFRFVDGRTGEVIEDFTHIGGVEIVPALLNQM